MRSVVRGYRRAVPVTTKSTSRAPHTEHTSRSRQSRTDVPAPCRAAISAVGLDLVLAGFAPDDQAHAGRSSDTECHRRFHVSPPSLGLRRVRGMP
jgi:hypothetical protein